MREAERLSELIGDVYDTVLDRSLWPGVLKKASDYIRGISAVVLWKDADKKGGIYFQDDGIDAHYRELFFRKYIKLSPTMPGQFFAGIEEPTSTADLVPYD